MKNLNKFVRNIFRTSALGLTMIILPFGGYAMSPSSDIQAPGAYSVQKLEEKTEIVYVTKNGKCYHKADCYHLKHSKIELKKKVADENKYLPCSACYD